MNAHDHEGHRHGSTDTPDQRRRLFIALGLTWAFAAVEALAGWRGGSLALLADAGHMVTDGAALALALLAAWLASRPASVRHSYGLGRAELIAALVNALAMLAVVAGIGWEAWGRFQSPRPIMGELVSLVAALGLGVNLLVAWMLSHGQENLNVRGAFLHVLGDVLGSVAAIAAGIVVWVTGWTPIDPLLSILIGGLVLAASLRLLREALHGLMDGVPFSIDLEHLGRELAAVPGVVEVHDLHVWALSGQRLALTAHVTVRELAAWSEILSGLRQTAQEHGIQHATFQPEVISWAPLVRHDLTDR
ncbi:cation diffusion facilitator family transporter [Sulfuricystis multivorans]|uniref:cation diffusion facilitator family transporter n=1 Tax=Sulfuricystis multivorans TaxID=2211108 RepID=UPI000F82B867|nr:cation diffusion facilitator family transporter [Sulfuricystis multivorans]